MGVRATSREAYRGVGPVLGERQKTVLTVLRAATRPVCNQELAVHLGWPINTVTPRVKELVDMGLAVEADRRVYRLTNRRVIHWTATS